MRIIPFLLALTVCAPAFAELKLVKDGEQVRLTTDQPMPVEFDSKCYLKPIRLYKRADGIWVMDWEVDRAACQESWTVNK